MKAYNKKERTYIMTRKEKMETILTIIETSVRGDKAELAEFVANEIARLSKPTSNKVSSALQKTNSAIKEKALEVLEDFGRPVTITEMMTLSNKLTSYILETKEGEKVETMTNQKLSSIMKRLVEDKKVIKTIERKRAYFSLPTEEGA